MKIANAVHAAGESVAARVPHGTIAVVLAARDEPHLRDLAARLAGAGVPHAPVVEADGTHQGQLMAVGIEPTTNRAAVRRLTSALPLVR